jgi:hypothetical protein
MAAYSKRIGRLHLEVSDNGASMHDYGHGCELKIVDGWNDNCPILNNRLSVDELRDLQYMISRALKRVRLKKAN